MNVLELFSGTHSVGKVCEEIGWNVVSVDMELPATHQVDILNFDYTQYPKDFFSVVWASPPCVAYSHLQWGWLGRKKKDGTIYTLEKMEADMKFADELVKRSLEIIAYFQPELWCLENPQTGRLKEREFMRHKPYYDVDYCKYSDWGYRKRTRIWTNKKDWTPLVCKNDCDNMATKTLHKNNCGNSKRLRAVGGVGTDILDRYRVPPSLIRSLFLD
jgi:hypothetical protein